jgi:hypothetical protein
MGIGQTGLSGKLSFDDSPSERSEAVRSEVALRRNGTGEEIATESTLPSIAA